MRAATFASVLALSIAGVACSEKAPAETEQAAAPQSTSEAQASGEFNLRYPTSSSQSAGGAAGEFNLRIPETSSPGAESGMRLPEGTVREDAFSDIPEVRTPGIPAEGNETPAEEPDDDIIRLD
ncbi:MAG: hypothetical protein RIB03_04625 [Henriciella sp.]|uniref:hypothetical protein n=1 Tax=Henriciella sp. TaxID=1968823 RepID=UPI00262C1799|nr:hypothetical protein [Henriciella sp.]